MEKLVYLVNLLSRADFYMAWIIIMSVIYLVIAVYKKQKGKDLFILIDYVAFVISTISIVGAISVLGNNFIEAYANDAHYDLNYMFNCLGNIAVFSISVKTLCDKIGYPNLFKHTVKEK